MLFAILAAIDAVAAAVALFFFFVGVADGTVSSFNIVLWLSLLGAIGIVLGGGFWLRARGRPGLAKLLLAVLALPALFGGLLMLLLIFNPPHWQ